MRASSDNEDPSSFRARGYSILGAVRCPKCTAIRELLWPKHQYPASWMLWRGTLLQPSASFYYRWATAPQYTALLTMIRLLSSPRACRKSIPLFFFRPRRQTLAQKCWVQVRVTLTVLTFLILPRGFLSPSIRCVALLPTFVNLSFTDQGYAQSQ